MFGIGNLFNFGLLFIRCDMSIRNTFYFGLAFFWSWSNIAWFKINILTWHLEIEPYRRGTMNKRGIILNIYVYLLTLLGREKWFRLFITPFFVAELFIFLPYGTYDDESTCGFHPCFFLFVFTPLANRTSTYTRHKIMSHLREICLQTMWVFCLSPEL